MSQFTHDIENLALFKWVGLGLVFVGLFVLLLAAITNTDDAPRRLWQQYVSYLDRRLKLLFIWTPGRVIATGQMLAFFAVLLLALLVSLPYWYIAIALIAAVPAVYIERMRRQRLAAIETQLDSFIMALANAMKATPSLGDAFMSVQQLVLPPFQQEVELAVKEMRVGSTLEQALLLMGGRMRSRRVDSALAAVLIGRQIGGNLPKILETTASTLREMERLEGVVRTKTAEGKMQLWVLAAFPLCMLYMFSSVKEGFFDPLTQSLSGYIVVIIAIGFWIASLVVARKILSVAL